MISCISTLTYIYIYIYIYRSNGWTVALAFASFVPHHSKYSGASGKRLEYSRQREDRRGAINTQKSIIYHTDKK